MTNRREFFNLAIATLITAPLARLGWRTPPGIGIRHITAYAAASDRFVSRIDEIYGMGVPGYHFVLQQDCGFASHSGKIGDTVTIQMPKRYLVSEGPRFEPEPFEIK